MKLPVVVLLCFTLFGVVFGSDVVLVTAKNGFSEWGLFGPESYLPLNATLGDRVTFRWNGFHTLEQFKDLISYTNCDFNGSLELADTTQKCADQPGFIHCFTWTANRTGTYYFGCRLTGHCTPGGMKIEVVVRPIVLNCTYANQTYGPGDELCIGGALWTCDSGIFVPKNQTCPSSEKCDYLGHLYANGDFVCDKGSNLRCWNSTFHYVGPCENLELINCTSLQAKCATAFSTEWNLPLVYCGQDGKLATAKTLCYPSSDEYWCDNNRLGKGTDWLLRASNAVHFGELCPEF